MKQFISFTNPPRLKAAICTLLILFSVGIGNAFGDATFTSSSEAATSAKNGVSLSVSGGSLAQGDYYRINKGATLTISVTSGNITAVTFTCTSSDYAKLASHTSGSSYSESGTTVSWTGEANEVTFTAKSGNSNNNFRFTQVVVTTSSGASCSSNPTIGASDKSSFSRTIRYYRFIISLCQRAFAVVLRVPRDTIYQFVLYVLKIVFFVHIKC